MLHKVTRLHSINIFSFCKVCQFWDDDKSVYTFTWWIKLRFLLGIFKFEQPCTFLCPVWAPSESPTSSTHEQSRLLFFSQFTDYEKLPLSHTPFNSRGVVADTCLRLHCAFDITSCYNYLIFSAACWIRAESFSVSFSGPLMTTTSLWYVTTSSCVTLLHE